MKTTIIILSLLLSFSISYAKEKEHILDTKIKKFCTEMGKEQKKDDYINKCIRHGKTMMRYETGGICKDKTNNNCFNFRAISKKNQVGFKILGLDKAGFTIFSDKTNSIKYFVFRFYKYDYKKDTPTIVKHFTHTEEHWASYIAFIKNFIIN